MFLDPSVKEKQGMYKKDDKIKGLKFRFNI